MCLDELRSNIAIKQKKRIAVYMCLYNYMVIDTNCNIVGLATKYREFACALLLMPVITDFLDDW